MTAVVGHTSLLLALVAAIVSAVIAIYAHRSSHATSLRGARIGAISVFVLVSVALIALEFGLIRSDFSLRYVARNSSLSTPPLFRIIGLWGGLEGSILFWQWIQALFVVLAAAGFVRALPAPGPSALAVLSGISSFFLLLLVGPASPFVVLANSPPDGLGLNVLLQNHPLMAIHPPLLYLGYVAFSVPYAVAMAVLLSRTPRAAAGVSAPPDWLPAIRRWSLLAWTFLTAGIFLGARWSYDVLGWGGYWAWDPVENASFMPWLVATALVHSLMVQERTGLLRVWNLALLIMTYLLTIFGTFLTRSGVIASVHSFTQSLIGPLFLSYFVVVLAFSLVVLLRGLSRIRSEGAIEAWLSREALMLLNNVILLTMAFTVFLGTVFPLVYEALTGSKVTVGPPFFNRLFVPLGVLLLVLMGFGTVARWGRSSAGDVRRLWILAGAAAVGVAVLAASGVSGLAALTGFGVVCFMAGAQAVEIGRAGMARRRATGQPLTRALAGLVATNRQRYAGYLVHLGLALAVLGIIASQAYRVETEREMAAGETMSAAHYVLRYEGLSGMRFSDKMVISARVSLLDTSATALAAGGDEPRQTAVLLPAENFYPHARTPVASPAVRSSWRDDLYVVLIGIDPSSGKAAIRAIVSPLVSWIWAGGALMVAAGVLSLWPRPRLP